MEQSQLAVTSNGRTVYELAHMNIPAIVIPQHKREMSHAFACEANGFLSLEEYVEGETEEHVAKALIKLLDDEIYRRKFFDRTRLFRFINNKQRVVKLLSSKLKE